MILLLAAFALADSITLDTGATIEGDLARYEFGGDCQVSVTEGDLAGVIVIVPCHRVSSFVRTNVRAPVPIGLPAAPVAQEGSAPSDAPEAAGVPEETVGQSASATSAFTEVAEGVDAREAPRMDDAPSAPPATPSRPVRF